ncbi:MAG: hypothetical protein G3M70_13745 [Candidatus Nitronauta litoralis]|uniref:Uncharacterized protein n=1 Tax=Candidatus Nitronauta litoralis TaxID=2705533 RepID=A0A7T0BZH6_9BACT|nr:MAG: hypothetical protein G3M70_13745 [Candidatus Nitronauta litoralis]
MPDGLFAGPKRINLYYLHELFRHSATMVRSEVKQELGEDIALNAGMWGGSYLVADDTGVSKTNVVRLYCITSVPNNSILDKKENLDSFMDIYRKRLQENFKQYSLELVDPKWGEPIPYTNRARPTTAMQLWDATKRVSFVRVFFVWNEATWADSIIYDTIRNIKVIKELLNIDSRPPVKEVQELKFLLQDVLIIYFTLRPILTPDFVEHAEPTITELFNHFINGMHDPELVKAQFMQVYSNALVYGYEEALAPAYKEEGLNIHRIEDWPAEKINYVPDSIKTILAPALEAKFRWFRKNLNSSK